MHLLLVVNHDESRRVYLRKLEELGATCETIGSLSELKPELCDISYQGLLFDMPSTVRATNAEKALMHDLLGLFPSLRLRWDPRTGQVGALGYGGQDGRKTSLEEFIQLRCASFWPRKLRYHPRVEVNCCVLLSPTPSFSPPETERTVTVNISEQGCFLFTSRDWSGREKAWLRFPDLQDPNPIEVVVRWRLEWGKGMKMPGIGVRFEKCSARQSEEIAALVKGRYLFDRV